MRLSESLKDAAQLGSAALLGDLLLQAVDARGLELLERRELVLRLRRRLVRLLQPGDARQRRGSCEGPPCRKQRGLNLLLPAGDAPHAGEVQEWAGRLRWARRVASEWP